MKSRVFIVLFGASVGVSAQTATQPELEACTELRTTAQRLACFETLTERGRKVSPAQVQSAITTATGADNLPEPAPLRPSRPSPAVSSAQEQPTQTPRAGADLGIEQLNGIEENAEPKSVQARVIEVSKGSRNHLYFHLENGAVWRQLEARYFPYPRRGAFEVEISRGVLGEYQLRVDGRGRMVRIRRVE